MKTFTVTAVAVALLYAAFRIMLFHVIGWHEGLILDWYTVYYPAAQVFDPYAVWGYFNPPWLAWLLSPLGLLSPGDSHVLWIVIILLLTIRCVYALGGDWLAAILTVISPGFLITIINGQVDVLILLGLLTGSWLLVLIKPQVAGMAIVYDVVQERRIDWPAVAIAAASLALFLLFMTRPDTSGLNMRANITPWPWGIPAGLALFGLSLYRRDMYLAALSTFFFAPYLSASSLLVYSAIVTSRYGRLVAVLFSVTLWARGIGWFL